MAPSSAPWALAMVSTTMAATGLGRYLLRWRCAAFWSSSSSSPAFLISSSSHAGSGWCLQPSAPLAHRQFGTAAAAAGHQLRPPSGTNFAGSFLVGTSPLVGLAVLSGFARRRLRRGTLASGVRFVGTHAEGEQSEVSLIDFRVGEIVSCEKHPDSDKLLVEQIDVGEEEPRQICSGIAKFLSPEAVTGRKVVVVSNLKAMKLGGVSSNGMVLCASRKDEGEDAETKELALVEAPEGAAAGERVVVEVEGEVHGDAAPPNRVAKKKLYVKVAPHLKTDTDGTVCFKSSPFMTSAGPCTAKELPESVVS